MFFRLLRENICVRACVCVCGWISYGGWCCFGLFMAPNRGLVSNYPGYRGMANRLQDVHWPVSCSSAGQSNRHRRVRKHTPPQKRKTLICYWAVIHLTFCPGCCTPKLYLVPWNIRWKNNFVFLIQVKGFFLSVKPFWPFRAHYLYIPL